MKTKIYAVIIWCFIMCLFIHTGYSQSIICQTPEASINSTGEPAFNDYVVKFKKQGKHLNTDLKIIPVVIHVIYRNNADRQQITMARIQGQIDATNEQLRRLNANAKETREIFLPVAADCDIQICLATRKPDRSSFDGVIYHKYPHFNIADLTAIRAATTLDAERYLNVWVLPDDSTGSAVFPWQKTDKLDGFYVGSKIFGITGADLQPLNDLGVTFTHELAHYLGVLHTFDAGTGLIGRCDLIHNPSVGDFCGDTPLDWMEGPGYNECNDGKRDCFEDGHEYSFFVQSENYMYYAFDSCLNMFSKDQRARMRACLNKLRSKLTLPSTQKFTGVNCKDLRGNCNSCSTPFVTSEGSNDLQADKLATEKKVIIFPNPTNGIVRILYHNLPVKKDLSITVYSELGQKLREVHSHTAINELNLASFPQGMYYIRITIDDVSITKYIIKATSGNYYSR
jgi:hypothetical protein